MSLSLVVSNKDYRVSPIDLLFESMDPQTYSMSIRGAERRRRIVRGTSQVIGARLDGLAEVAESTARLFGSLPLHPATALWAFYAHTLRGSGEAIRSQGEGIARTSENIGRHLYAEPKKGPEQPQYALRG